MSDKSTPFQATSVNPHGLTNLIRNLGRDCTPSQYLREFTKNSIEACQRTGKADAQILLDYNPQYLEDYGVFKLSITDNGDGMSIEQMLNLLNNLSASGARPNEHQNYGVGAKISAMTRNHSGILYESWKNGVGHSVLICYNEAEDVYGIQGYKSSTGETVYAKPVGDDVKPYIINEHGTRVTLLGMHFTQDTMLPPQGVDNDRSKWILTYLNTRFYVLPKGIKILARVDYNLDNPTLPAGSVPGNAKSQLVEVLGFKSRIESFSIDHGQLELSGPQALQSAQEEQAPKVDRSAIAYWWILPEGCEITGQTALINQGEVFDVQNDRTNRSLYFGVIVGRNRVVIYVEPKDAVQNTARTGLVKPDGSHLQWNEWQDEFRNNMPEGLRRFIEMLLQQSVLATNSKVILNRLAALKDFYQLSGYQPIRPEFEGEDELIEQAEPEPVALPKVEADELVDHEADLKSEIEDADKEKPKDEKEEDKPPEDKQEEKPEEAPSEPPKDSAEEPDSKEDESYKKEPNEEDKSKDAKLVENLFPFVEWTSEDKSPQLSGKAAEFLELENAIIVNQDFKGFKDLNEYFKQRFGDSAEIAHLIKITVAEGIEQILMECVAGILSLKARDNWNPNQINACLTKEALTACVMQRYWLVKQVEEDLMVKIRNIQKSMVS